MSQPQKEIRVAPNIYQTFKADGRPHGWRVYVSRDGVLKPKRFPPDATIDQLQAFVRAFKDENKKLRTERRELAKERAGTLAGDAETYLALKTVRAMPSYSDRVREIRRWVKAFGRRSRPSLIARELDEQLQAWRDEGQSAASVNKYRTALMSLYTRLDGRGAANPVRETKIFEEPPARARGPSYDVIRALLDAMPAEMSRPVKGEKGSRSRGSLTRVRFEIMAWTGMTPAQIKALKPAHINLRERWFVSPPRKKGARRSRTPRPEIRKPMTPDAAEAFKRFVALKAWGAFNTRSMRHSLERARKKVERDLRKKRKDPALTLPHLTPYDFRHAMATELFRRTGNLPLVAEMLDHSSLQMTKRYAMGAMSDVLKKGMQQFHAAVGRRARR